MRLLAPLLGALVALPLLVGAGAAQVRLRPGVTVRSLEQAVAKDPYDPVALYELALGYWSKKDWDDVERTLRRTLEVEPRNAPALMALAHLPFARRPRLWEEEENGTVPPEWMPALLERNQLLHDAYLYDPMVDLQIVGAVAPDEKILRRSNGDASAEMYALVGQVNFRNGRYDQAYAWMDRLARALGEGVDSSRTPDFVLWYRGLSAAHLNDIPAALRDFRLLRRKVEDGDPATVTIEPALATYIHAFLLHRAGRSTEALEAFRHAIVEDLGLWMAHVQMARIYEEQRAWPEAIGERRLALATKPDDPTLLLDLGMTLFNAGRPEEAVPVLAAAAEGLPHNYRVPYFQGGVALALGRPQEARLAYQRFLTLVPGRFTVEIADARRILDSLP